MWHLAQGPVMIGTPAKPNDPKVGRVLGGGKVKKDHPFTLVIKENRESFRTSKMLETVVNERFHEFENGHQKGCATAKTPSYLELKVPTLYHQNQDHFFRVVQLLPMIDSPELRTRRTAAWSKELLDPTTAGVAAMKLEGLGPAGIEPLKTGLQDSNAQVRFFCAESLAYLNDTAGVDVLGETAIKNPIFRVYALAALAAMDQPASHLKLRKLMDEPEIELRYGAFNALRTLDPHDPFLGLVRVLDEPKQEADDDEPSDSMAVAITSASAAAAPTRTIRSACTSSTRRAHRCPRVADPPIRDRRLRPPAEAAPAHRAGHGFNLSQCRRERRQDRAQQDRPEPVWRCATSSSRLRWSWPTSSARQPAWGRPTPRSSRSSKPPSGRRTYPASLSSTRCPSPTGSTSKPSWARTRPPSATTRSNEPREKRPSLARRWLFGIFGRDSDDPPRDTASPTTTSKDASIEVEFQHTRSCHRKPNRRAQPGQLRRQTHPTKATQR